MTKYKGVYELRIVALHNGHVLGYSYLVRTFDQKLLVNIVLAHPHNGLRLSLKDTEPGVLTGILFIDKTWKH